MAGEIQGSFVHSATVYALVRDRNANIWNTVTPGLEAYATGHYSGYAISCPEQGTASAYFVGNFPPTAPPGTYNVEQKQQLGANPAETDPTITGGSIDWNGTNVAQLSDTTVSGSSLISQQRLTRGVMIQNYPIYLKSAADHVTPFTSGSQISGQVSRDGAAFTALQSGKFTEVGNGVYNLQALTSGDLAASQTVTLLFTGQNVLGGLCDPLVQTFVLQRTSGF